MINQSGQTFIELIVAIGISVILLPALITGFVASREGKAQQNQRLEATALLKEAEEAVRVVREKDWNVFAVNGIFHPVISSTTYSLSSGPEIINGYTRQIVISDALRDANGAIASQSGTIDPSTKKIISTISWETPFASQVSSTQYLSRYLKNTLYQQTTETDFNTGSKSGVLVTNTSGGEITLGEVGSGDWCQPNLSISAVDLPKSGVANAISAIEGKVFAGTGENASGVSYATVSISNASPPVGTVVDTFDGYKTNGIFGEQNYAYLATDNNHKEVVIIGISQTPYTEAGYFDAPGNGSASSVYVANDIGYATVGNKLYDFDLSSDTGNRTGLRPIKDSDGVTLAGTGKQVKVVGNYAYVAIDSASNQLQIVDISNPDNMTVVGSTSVNGLQAKDVIVNSSATRAYLATANSLAQKELYIIDITSKLGNQPVVGSYEANGMDPKGITVVPGNRAVLVGTGGEEYQAINIATESNPLRCGGLNIDTGVNGVSSVIEADGDAYSYIITGDASAELKIILGGPGGSFSLNGTFESSTFNAGGDVSFNRLIFTGQTPLNTILSLQVGIGHKNTQTNDCSDISFTYVGPDGSPTSYFATSNAIPMSSDSVGFENPGQCFRYKAYLSSTDQTVSPTLFDASVNYSP